MNTAKKVLNKVNIMETITKIINDHKGRSPALLSRAIKGYAIFKGKGVKQFKEDINKIEKEIIEFNDEDACSFDGENYTDGNGLTEYEFLISEIRSYKPGGILFFEAVNNFYNKDNWEFQNSKSNY